METKTCRRCQQAFPIDRFRRKGAICRTCEAALSREYKAQNREKVKQGLKEWRQKNADHVREYNQHYRQEHPEQVRAGKRAAYRRNADKIKGTQRERYRYNIGGKRDKARAYRAAHAEEMRERQNAWRAANIDKALERERASRARTKERRLIYGRVRNKFNRPRLREIERAVRRRNPYPHRLQEHRRRARAAGVVGDFTPAQWTALTACFGNKCLCCGRTEGVQIDHVVPLSRGGSNSIANLQPLCGPCNRKKHKKDTDYRDPALLAQFLTSLQEAPATTD